MSCTLSPACIFKKMHLDSKLKCDYNYDYSNMGGCIPGLTFFVGFTFFAFDSNEYSQYQSND